MVSARDLHFKMTTFTGVRHTHCVSWFEEMKSVTTVQQNFCILYGKNTLSRHKVYNRTKILLKLVLFAMTNPQDAHMLLMLLCNK